MMKMMMDVLTAIISVKNNVLYVKGVNAESVMLKVGNLILINALLYVEIN